MPAPKRSDAGIVLVCVSLVVSRTLTRAKRLVDCALAAPQCARTRGQRNFAPTWPGCCSALFRIMAGGPVGCFGHGSQWRETRNRRAAKPGVSGLLRGNCSELNPLLTDRILPGPFCGWMYRRFWPSPGARTVSWVELASIVHQFVPSRDCPAVGREPTLTMHAQFFRLFPDGAKIKAALLIQYGDADPNCLRTNRCN